MHNHIFTLSILVTLTGCSAGLDGGQGAGQDREVPEVGAPQRLRERCPHLTRLASH